MIEHLLVMASVPVFYVGKVKLVLWWWPFVFAFFKNMFIILDLLLIVAIVMVIMRFQKMGREIFDAVEEAIASGKISKGKVQRQWDEARDLINSGSLEDNKEAIFIAEKILDDCLRSASLSGENLERRLLRIRDTEINFRDDIIWAYRIKVHLETEPDFETDKEELERAFYILERAMKELNIL